MTKLLYSATMSLDGSIAGPGGDMRPLDASGTHTLWFEILTDRRSG